MATDGNCTRYSDLCPLCSTRINADKDYNIFEDEGSTQQENREVHVSDYLSKVICQYCFYKWEVCFEFKERTGSVLVSLYKELIWPTETQLNVGSDHTDISPNKINKLISKIICRLYNNNHFLPECLLCTLRTTSRNWLRWNPNFSCTTMCTFTCATYLWLCLLMWRGIELS